jgi:serine/threonine protein kinase
MTEREIFLSALEIADPAAREAHVHSACEGDTALLARVEALLTLNDSQSQFLETPVMQQMAGGPDADSATTIMCGDGSTEDQEVPTEFSFDGEEAHIREKRDEESDEIPLGYLQPSDKPGSLGRLAHYEVVQVLGRGAFGIVLKALDEKLQRAVAIKVLAPQIAATSPARKRFLREARASGAIRHEYVVNIHAVDETPLPYLVMEYIPGQTLQQRLIERGPLDVATTVRFGRQIAEALAAAHDRDLIHRDIKPGNILLEAGVTERVKITDFGLARAVDDASMTQSGLIAGTPMYMAPEQALGRKLDRRADLFSMGSVLYQMISGRPPFRASSTLAVLKRVTEDEPRPIQEIIPETPTWLCDIIARLQAKDPDKRYQSAREVAEVLADCEAQLKIHGRLKDFSKIPCRKPAPAPGAGRWKWIVAATLLLSLVALATTESLGITHLFQKPRQEFVADAQQPDLDPDSQVNSPVEPSGSTSLAPAGAAFADADARRIAALPAEQQVEEVRKELVRRNPDFDQSLTPTIENGVVIGLEFAPVHVTDLSPLQALAHLQKLAMWGFAGSDLTPLKGLPLKWLNCGAGGQKLDLTPLAGSPLEFLCVNSTQVSDLSPLKNVPLRRLECVNAPVADLSPLKDTPLTELHCNQTKVSDLSPLKGKPLKVLHIYEAAITDLTPLQGMPLEDIRLTPKNITRGLDILRDMQSLKTIGTNWTQFWPAAEFWKRYDKGEFGVATSADADRRAAEYVLSIGGFVKIDDQEQKIYAAADLPREPFRLTVVDLPKNPQVSDAGLAIFKDCRNVKVLALYHNSQVTDAGLAHFQNCKAMTQLHLQGTVVTDAGLACFQGSQSITDLYLSGPLISDTGLPYFKGCKEMGRLCVAATRVSDAGLAHFKGAPLSMVWIQNSGITDLTPLQGAPLYYIGLSPKNITRGLEILRGMTSLKSIGVDSSKDIPPAEFWERYDKGEFSK